MYKILCTVIILISVFTFSNCYANTEIITTTGQYTVGDGPDENISVAKERARIDAMRAAAEKAGVYIESYTEISNMNLVKDEVKAVAAQVLKIQSEVIKPIVNGDTVTYVCTITALVDTSNVNLEIVANNRELIERNVYLENQISDLQKEIFSLKQQYNNTTTIKDKNIIQKKITNNENFLISLEYYRQAGEHYDKKDFYHALEYYNKSIELYPKHLNAYIDRGITYINTGDINVGIKDFDYVIDCAPNNSTARYNRGTAYDELGYYQKAIDDYSAALENRPNYYKAVLNRGITYTKNNQLSLALIDFTRAIKLANNEQLPTAYRVRGLLYKVIGKNDAAIRDLEQSLSLKYDKETQTMLDELKGISAKSNSPSNPSPYTF